MASVMAIHGLFLAGSGCYINSALGMGAGFGLVGCAGLSASGSFSAYMTGVHLALLLQGGTAATFGVQACRASIAQVQGAKMCSSVACLLPYVAMSVSSVAALNAMKRFKPKKKLEVELRVVTLPTCRKLVHCKQGFRPASEDRVAESFHAVLAPRTPHPTPPHPQTHQSQHTSHNNC